MSPNLELYPESSLNPPEIYGLAHRCHVRSWAELVEIFSTVAYPRSGFVFRGQASEKWRLESTLDRFANVTKGTQAWIEDYLISRFQRLAPSFLDNLPDTADRLSWLALLRHHGAPSRLMDWTWSPYVATYFALESALVEGSSADCVVWALDARTISEKTDAWLRKLYDGPIPSQRSVARSREWFASLALGVCPKWCLLPLQPNHANPRMIAQQGVFLATMAQCRFEESLLEFFQKYKADNGGEPVTGEVSIFRRIVIHPPARKEILAELYRMNISHATLFPGIDGLVRSLTLLASIRQGDWMGESWLDADL